MAARKTRFKPITIKSVADLNRILDIASDHDLSHPRFASAFQARMQDTPANRLSDFLLKYDISICTRGRRQVLASVGKVNSWREYLLAHWDVDGEFRRWFFRNPELIGLDRNRLTSAECKLLTPDLMFGGELPTARQYLRDIKAVGDKFVEWPFKKAKKRRKAKRGRR